MSPVRAAPIAHAARGVQLHDVLAPWLARARFRADAGPPVVVGCSGGVDSLALLALAAASGLEPVAVHVDHGLRPGSAAEAEHVAAAASALGAGFLSERVSVPPGANLEERAREARHAALDRARRRERATAVLLGHTRDDQAETVLLNLLRGAATAGLGGMPERRGSLARPILGLSRADTVEICGRLRLDPIDDPMNADIRFRRAWLRREVIPRLEAGAGRDLRAVIARQADVLRAESDLLDALAARELEALSYPAGGPVAARGLTAIDRALARRVVRRLLGDPPPTLDEVEAVMEVASGLRHAVQVAGGRRVERTAGRLHLVATGTTPERNPVRAAVPGRAEAGGLVIESWVERSAPLRWPDGRWTCVLDAETAGGEIVIRPGDPGERFVPLGMATAKRLSDVLAGAGVPPTLRSTVPLVAHASGPVMWAVGYRVSAHARVTGATRRYLWLRARVPQVTGERR